MTMTSNDEIKPLVDTLTSLDRTIPQINKKTNETILPQINKNLKKNQIVDSSDQSAPIASTSEPDTDKAATEAKTDLFTRLFTGPLGGNEDSDFKFRRMSFFKKHEKNENKHGSDIE